MPKQHSSAKGRRRANRYILALAGRNPGKGRQSFRLALESGKKQGKMLLVSPVQVSPRGESLQSGFGAGEMYCHDSSGG